MQLNISVSDSFTNGKIDLRKPLFLLTCVFFMWGLSYGLLDVLNKHFQESMGISKAQSGLLQFSYFFAYFVVSRPAAVFNDRFGYKGGILLGLCLFAVGALLFIPASSAMSFSFFLGALFVLASGLGCLETAANPYATLLGDSRKAEKRLNMAQSFCSLGTAIGPLIGGMLFFNSAGPLGASQHDMVKWVYVGLAIVVTVIAFLISITSMPETRSASHIPKKSSNSLLSHRNFVSGVIAQFFSMAALVGVGAFFINYATENWSGMTSQQAAWLLSASIFLFMAGRFISTFVMDYIAPNKLLICYALAAVVLSIFVVLNFGRTSVIALSAIFFFMSIMFPTIFSLGIRGLKEKTKKGSSILMMSVVGGGIAPYAMGRIADNYNTSLAYIVPLLSFVMIFVCGLYFRNEEAEPLVMPI